MITETDIRLGMAVLERLDPATAQLAERNAVHIAFSLAGWQQRGLFDGTVESAIHCMLRAGYDVVTL